MLKTMALAGLTLTGCRRWPKEQLAPFSSNPAGYVPGVAEFYASSWELGGVGQGLVDVGNIQPGQTLLINGAGGGVGTFAVQIARLYGVESTGVDHTSKLAMMLSLGFDHVIDYTREDFTKKWPAV